MSLATLLVLWLVAELTARALYTPENIGTVIRFDEALGWSLKPNASMRSVSWHHDLDYRVHINSLGLRNSEVSLTRPPGKHRILILGDSVVFGTGVDAQWRFSEFLQRALGDGCEVINASAPGWGNDQELIFFESRCRQLQPDVVVVTLTMANDVINNMLDHLFLESAPKPRFEMEGDSLRLVPARVPAREEHHPSRIRELLKKSHLVVWGKRRLDMTRYKNIVRESIVLPRGFEKKHFQAVYSNWSVYERHYAPELESAWQVSEAILDRFSSDCHEMGAELLVFGFPLRIEVDDPWRTRLLDMADIDAGLLDMTRPYRRLAAFCQEHDIAFFYPIDEFKKGIRRRYLYLEHDNHPNAFGHALAARVLLPQLQERYNMPFHVAGVDRDYFDLFNDEIPPDAGPSN